MDEITTNEGWIPQDGDVCFLSVEYNHLIIFRKFENDKVKPYVNLTYRRAGLPFPEKGMAIHTKNIVEFRPATDLERLDLFHKMMKKGKMWDAENRKSVDYPMWDTKKGGEK